VAVGETQVVGIACAPDALECSLELAGLAEAMANEGTIVGEDGMPNSCAYNRTESAARGGRSGAEHSRADNGQRQPRFERRYRL